MKRLLILLTLVLLIAVPPAYATLARAPLADDAVADSIRVEKAKRRLTLFRAGVALKSYRVALGWEPLGAKEREGDGRTPEGRYTADFHKAESAFHRALHVSYPNAADRVRAKELGVSPGGDIMIHGLPNGEGWIGRLHTLHDWTRGCIAVTDPEIEEIFRVVPDGAAIEILP